MSEDLTALGALRYAGALEYVEDFTRAWHDTMRDPLGRASLTVAYQQAQVDGEDRGGMRCCGTASEWHRPWCGTGPRRYRAQEVALTRPQMDALKAVGRHRDLSRGQDGITSTAVIRRLQAMGLVMVNPHTPQPGGWTAALTENGRQKLAETDRQEQP